MDNSLEMQLNAHGKSTSRKKYIWFITLFIVLAAFGSYFFIMKKSSSNSAVTYNTQEIKKVICKLPFWQREIWNPQIVLI